MRLLWDSAQPLTVPTMLVHSFWDAEDIYGALAVYKAVKPKDSKNMLYLAMGPWQHGGAIGDVGWQERQGDAVFEDRREVAAADRADLCAVEQHCAIRTWWATAFGGDAAQHAGGDAVAGQALELVGVAIDQVVGPPHGVGVDLAQQRLQRPDQPRVPGPLRRDQDDRVIGRQGAARIVEHGHVINGAIDSARLHTHDKRHSFALIGGRGDHVDRIGLRYIGDWFEDAFS